MSDTRPVSRWKVAMLGACTVAMVLVQSCAKPPTNAELAALCKRGFTLDLKVTVRGRPHKIQGEMVFPVTIDQRFIFQGVDGNLNGVDVERHDVTEYLVRRDNFGAWDCMDSRCIVQEDVGMHRRPANVSLEDFYRGKASGAQSASSAKSSARAARAAEKTSRGKGTQAYRLRAGEFNEGMEDHLQKLEAKASRAGLQGEAEAKFAAQVAKVRALMRELTQIPESNQDSIDGKVSVISDAYFEAEKMVR